MELVRTGNMMGKMFMLLLSGYLLLGVGVPSIKAQDADKKAEEVEVEVRMLERSEEGEAPHGSLPDSLGGKYFFHSNGKVYKYFEKYEMALAHYREGYYPRPLKGVENDVVYIGSAPTVKAEAGTPTELWVKKSRMEELRKVQGKRTD